MQKRVNKCLVALHRGQLPTYENIFCFMEEKHKEKLVKKDLEFKIVVFLAQQCL